MADTVKLASELAEMLWEAEGFDLDNIAVQELLVACGIVHYRKPKASELADPEWWGHELDIGPDDNGVGEFTPEMKELRKAALPADAS